MTTHPNQSPKAEVSHKPDAWLAVDEDRKPLFAELTLAAIRSHERIPLYRSANVSVSDERVLALIRAVEARGVCGHGYCFCARERDTEKQLHEPECAELRAALADIRIGVKGEALHLLALDAATRPTQAGGQMNISQVIRAAIPTASDALCEHIVWGRTPYPFTKLSARDFYRAASRYRRASEHGIELCEFCDRPATNHCLCEKCDSALAKCKPEDKTP